VVAVVPIAQSPQSADDNTTRAQDGCRRWFFMHSFVRAPVSVPVGVGGLWAAQQRCRADAGSQMQFDAVRRSGLQLVQQVPDAIWQAMAVDPRCALSSHTGPVGSANSDRYACPDAAGRLAVVTDTCGHLWFCWPGWVVVLLFLSTEHSKCKTPAQRCRSLGNSCG